MVDRWVDFELKVCERCGAKVTHLIPTYVFRNGERVAVMLCYSCHIEVTDPPNFARCKNCE
jgi:hypothetical protein